MTVSAIRRFMLGEALPTERIIHERLAKYLALPVFGSDPISSSAYATEEILLALVLAGSIGLQYAAGVALAITLLFVVVSISYRQTVAAYPSGGGAYIVARENLGDYPGLIAAAALMTDYVLTVAVSTAAGVAAIISAAPELAPYRVSLCVLSIAFITLANLRGARESGTLFAPPVYLFIGTVLLMILVGGYRLAAGTALPTAFAPPPEAIQGVTLLLLLKAFASGCAALTGIEAISNGVPAFKPPASRNASTTLMWMVGICVTLFAGITILAQAFHIVPDETGGQTVLSMLGQLVFGRGVLYLMLQASTALILILAANTAFADFPRLSSILARDGFAPRQLANLGDRLVFSNGILLLGLCSAALVVIFGGRTHHLIPLYAVGVFVSFTLSQLGMVIHWRRERGANWTGKAAVNACGAVTTGIVLLVVASMKFLHGAYIVLLIIPLLVLVMRKIAGHYHNFAAALAVAHVSPERLARHTVVLLMPGVHRGTLTALAYAKTISPHLEALYIEANPGDAAGIPEQWRTLDLNVPLTVLPSRQQSFVESVRYYLRTLRAEHQMELVTVVIPEFTPTRWWHNLLHNQQNLLLKFALMFEPDTVVTSIGYRAEERRGQAATTAGDNR